MLTSTKKAKQTDFLTLFNRDTCNILHEGDIEALIGTMEQLYKDVFVYTNPDTEDYNTLSCEDRYKINELYELMLHILKVALKYDHRLWAESEVLIDASEAKGIADMFGQLSGEMTVYKALLEEMIVTTLLYKPVSLLGQLEVTAIAFYYNCKQIRGIIHGYAGGW